MAKRGRRRYFKATEKVAILKRHLVEREEVSAICEDLKIHPNQFYEWQKLFFENGVKAFESDEKQEATKLRLENERLTQKLHRKDAVLSELMEEHLTLKKSFGET
jgi:transposase